MRHAFTCGLCIAAILLAPMRSWGQCSTPCHGPNSDSWATDGTGAERGQLTVLSSLRYGYAGNLQGGDHELPPSGDRFGFATLTLGADYRALPLLAVRARVPLTWQKLRFQDGQIFTQAGLADLELAATYDVIRSPAWIGTIGLGATLPTGASTDRPIVGADVPTPFQLGTGTFNPLFLAWLYRRVSPSLDVHAAFEGRLVPYANRYGLQSESVYSIGPGIDYRVFDGRVAAGLDLLYIHKTRIRYQDEILANSGQEILQVGWRLGYRLTERWRAQLTGRFHPYQRVNLKQVCEAVGATVDLAYVVPSLGG